MQLDHSLHHDFVDDVRAMFAFDDSLFGLLIKKIHLPDHIAISQVILHCKRHIGNHFLKKDAIFLSVFGQERGEFDGELTAVIDQLPP